MIIMAEFKTEKFKKLIDYKSGYTWSKGQELKKLENGALRVLTVTNIQKELDLSEELYLKNVSEKDKIQKAVSKDWAIAVSSNGNRKRIGNAVFIEEDTEYLFASFLTAFKPKPNFDILPKYFFYWLNSHTIQEKITSVSEGTTGLGNLDIRYLRNLDIEYPEDLGEQQKIASILTKMDDAIQTVKNTIEKAGQLKKALMQNLLTGRLKPDGTRRRDNEFLSVEKYGRVPSDWNFGHLGDIAEIIAGQSPIGESYNNDGKGVPMLNGPTEFTDRYPIAVQYTTNPTKMCKRGDILFTVRGSSTGRMNIADKEYCIGRGIAAIREIENISNINFIYFTLITIANRILAEAKSAGSTFPNVNRGELLKKKIIYPKKNERSQIANKINSVENVIIQKEKKIQKLECLKKALMQNLLTGKVRVKIDEPIKEKPE